MNNRQTFSRSEVAEMLVKDIDFSKVNAIIQRRGMRMAHIARACGVAPVVLNYRMKKRIWPVKARAAFAAALDVELIDILED